MRTGIVAFFMGNIALLYWPYLPDKSVTLGGLFSLLFLMALLYKVHKKIVSSSPNFYYLCVLILSAASGAVYTSLYLNFNMPTLDLKQWQGKTIQVIGTIDSIPYQTTSKQGFDFYIRAGKMPDHAELDSWDYSFKGKVKLSWYDTAYKVKSINKLKNIPHDKGFKLAIGQLWQFDIRLKKPNGLMNPGGFDYEKWLYQNRILASGYVRDARLISQLESSSSLFTVFNHQLRSMRQKLSDQLDSSLIDYPYTGLIKALSIGYRHDMSAQQWKLFLQSGTNHLVAISGLHIGLMSSLVWLLVNTLWKSSSTLSLRIPAYYVASVFALLAAIIYAGLAGFAIPTQRALIMLCVVFVALMLKREILSSYILLLALFIVLIFDPLSPLAIGFWLSFAAVAIIIFSLSGRLNIAAGHLAKLWQLARMQMIIFVGLLPLMIIIFHHFSLSSPLANLLAVPLMSFIIVPITLLASALLFIFPSLALWLFELLKWPIDALFIYLEKLTQLPENYYFLPEISLPVIILSFIACLWLLMPRGWPGRFLGVLLLLPAMLSPAMNNREAGLIPEGEVKMTVLDVAQGLSIVLRTRTHTLVYDTGDKFSARFNMSDMVSIPYLRLQGLDEINKLVLSHSDRDHAGSYMELQQLSINEVLSGEPQKIVKKYQIPLTHASIKQCVQGQQWQWDGVKFKVLSPDLSEKYKKANNQSCVILVTTQSKQKILLTGDIEKTVEEKIIADYPELNIDILVVPHHGSKTSSSIAFLEQIKPEIAVFSYGYRNRFRHPADVVMQRYTQRPVRLFNTSDGGAIELSRDLNNNAWKIKQYRLENQRIWRRREVQ